MSREGDAFQAWLSRAFDDDARWDIFGRFSPTPESPLLVLLGGQPAAGKTSALRAIIADNPTARLVPIVGDDLRQYHPDYVRLARETPQQMPAATALVSGGLIRLALDHALTHRYSVLLEGTFRDPTMVTGTATRFAEAGYRVEVVAVATPGPVSRLSADQRSLGDRQGRFGRWTPPEAHESGLAGAPKVVAALETLPFVSHIQVHSRDRLLYDNARTSEGTWAADPHAAAVLTAELTRHLTPVEAADWLASYEEVFQLALHRPGYLNPLTAPAYVAMERDAAALIEVVSTDPAIDAGALERRPANGAPLSPPPCHHLTAFHPAAPTTPGAPHPHISPSVPPRLPHTRGTVRNHPS